MQERDNRWQKRKVSLHLRFWLILEAEIVAIGCIAELEGRSVCINIDETND